MGFFQVGDGQPKITLGGHQGPVPEDLLDVPQVSFVLQKMGRARVPPHMRRHVLFYFCHAGVFAHEVIERGLARVRLE